MITVQSDELISRLNNLFGLIQVSKDSSDQVKYLRTMQLMIERNKKRIAVRFSDGRLEYLKDIVVSLERNENQGPFLQLWFSGGYRGRVISSKTKCHFLEVR